VVFRFVFQVSGTADYVKRGYQPRRPGFIYGDFLSWKKRSPGRAAVHVAPHRASVNASYRLCTKSFNDCNRCFLSLTRANTSLVRIFIA
jgi:hypothetical protein